MVPVLSVNHAFVSYDWYKIASQSCFKIPILMPDPQSSLTLTLTEY